MGFAERPNPILSKNHEPHMLKEFLELGLPSHLATLADKMALRLPSMAAHALSILPTPLEQPVLERLLNRALAEPIAEGRFDFLAGHTVAICVTDAAWCMNITHSGHGALRVITAPNAETRISASALDFLGLAVGHIDPDTLFFQRRLRIEGSVALGLEVKNTLDGVDRTALPAPLRAVLQLVRLWFTRTDGANYGPLQDTGHPRRLPDLSN